MRRVSIVAMVLVVYILMLVAIKCNLDQAAIAFLEAHQDGTPLGIPSSAFRINETQPNPQGTNNSTNSK